MSKYAQGSAYLAPVLLLGGDGEIQKMHLLRTYLFPGHTSFQESA
jgi:hypothetical protein